jgi:hypothetical protein
LSRQGPPPKYPKLNPMKPVHSAHVSADPGFNKSATPESIAKLLLVRIYLASDMSMEINSAVLPIDHAWRTT